ncbi:LysM domain-containing protein [uncultured Selenomonas sp.]|uniref:LysM peptidoglycan-binding domain-containing protein n=1 Tax=uncultured Selenomonas sp. TaxID=159275 RepID=UPI0028D560EE|nr:LysM domain-containing protein [uncultured Selenomonas sp.]
MRDFWKTIIISGAFVVTAVLSSGAIQPFEDDARAVLVEETYTVRQGDTVWNIAEEFCTKNTGTKRYILEYKAGMEENNPWLIERRGMIYPGDELKMTYWVKEVK